MTRNFPHQVLVLVAAALLAACGGSGTGSAPTTTADKCKSETLKATEVGVTADKITVTVMADVGSPLALGLFLAIGGITVFWQQLVFQAK